MTDSSVPRVLQTALSFLTRGESKHPQCCYLLLGSDGVLTKQDQWEPVSNGDAGLVIRNQWVLDTSATVEYESNICSGYVTLLAVADSAWTAISVVSVDCTNRSVCTSEDLSGAVACCWEGYCKANRACDGTAMSQFFHPECRLTYSSKEKDGSVTVVSSTEFYDMVANRYSLPIHSPYAKFKDSSEVSARDSLLGVSLVAPELAFVRLKVGHPPFLWTDLLVCAKIRESLASTGDFGRWWIVAKSSSSDPFELT